MHLTLRFLGEVDEAVLPTLQAALDREAPPVDADLTLARGGTFGGAARTRVAWLGVEGDLDALRALAARVERAVGAAGLPEEDRPLRVHLTLARVRQDASPGARRAVADAVSALPAPPPEPFRARELLLVRSHLGGRGPRYEVLSRHG